MTKSKYNEFETIRPLRLLRVWIIVSFIPLDKRKPQ